MWPRTVPCCLYKILAEINKRLSFKSTTSIAAGLFFQLLLSGGTMSLSSCAPPVRDTPPSKLTRSVLVCADSDVEIFEPLKSRFTRLDVSRFTRTPECARGALATSEVGRTCLDSESSCSTPRYVDGKPLANSASAYDVVLLLPQLLHGSLSAKVVKPTTLPDAVKLAYLLGGQSDGLDRTVPAEDQLRVSLEIGYSGEVFLFDPRLGQLHIGKRFKDIASERLRDLLRDLLRR